MEKLDFTKSLNPLYGYEAVQDQMRTSFAKSKPSVLLLPDFFVARSYKEFLHMFDALPGSVISAPERHSYTELTLSQPLRGFFASPAFFDFAWNATGLKIKDVRLSAQRFGHRDFTLLHDEQAAHERCIFIFMMAPLWDASYGGSMIFSYGDERAPLVFEPRGNTLVFFKVPKDMREFVKYCNHFSNDATVTYVVGEFLVR